MADKRQPRVEDEPSLIPSFMRHASVEGLPDRQTHEEMRMLGRRGPSRALAAVFAILLVGLLGVLGYGAWTLLGGNGSRAVGDGNPTPDTPPVVVVIASPTPGAVATSGAVAVPQPPGRQPRDLTTPTPSPSALPNVVNTTPTPSASPSAEPTRVAPSATPSVVAAQPTDSAPPPALRRPNGALIRAPQLTGSGLRSINDLRERLERAGSRPVPVDAPVFGVPSWKGPEDLSAQLWMGWDATNLYLLVRVIDDTFVQEATGILLYQGDSVEIQFDGDLAGDFTSRVYSDDDWQISLSPGNLVGPNPQWQWWIYRGNVGSGSIQLLSRLEADGYTLAAAIPWSLLRTEPKADAAYGFALNINDNDTTGSKQQDSMVSTSPVRQLNDPTSWGTLQLTGPSQ